MRNKLIGAGVAALALTVTAGVVASTVGPTVDASKSKKGNVTVLDASKSKGRDGTVQQASKSKKTDVVIIPVSKSKKTDTGDVVITQVSKSKKTDVVIVPAAYARGPVAAVPASYARGPMAAPAAALSTVRYTSCALTATHGYGSTRVSLTMVGDNSVNITMTITNHQDRAITLLTNRISDEYGVRRGPGGWLAPGQSLSWTVKSVDFNTGRFYVRAEATTNHSIVDACGGDFSQ